MPFLMIPIISSNTIDKGVIFLGKVDFLQFYQIFSYFILIGLFLGSYLSQLNDLLWFRILQQYQLFEMTPVSSFAPLQTVTINGFKWNLAIWNEYRGFLEKAYKRFI